MFVLIVFAMNYCWKIKGAVKVFIVIFLYKETMFATEKERIKKMIKWKENTK